MSERVEAARKKYNEAGEEFEAVVASEYPIGSVARWSKGEYPQKGEVLKHGYRGRLYVRNLATGKAYWIDSYFMRGGIGTIETVCGGHSSELGSAWDD